MSEPVLRLKGLSAGHRGRRVLHEVSLDLAAGEVLALVGASGSGKTTLLRVLLGMLPLDAGSIELAGRRFEPRSRRRLGDLADRVQMVFQDPLAALDPRWSAARSLAEALPRGRDPAVLPALLAEVGLPIEVADRRPRELSGGQRQRLAIARALAAEPRLLLLDEATSALDVSVQAQILELLERLIAERGLAALFVSHDLAVVRRLAGRCALLDQGRLVECRPTEELLRAPEAAATRALIAAARFAAADSPGPPPG
ncbi:MAG: ABC transporter ATP-binding protein [Planctomycetes bacterium]|nr:ABC transporter ATP-binding protein [Planctomycetota bacterium]